MKLHLPTRLRAAVLACVTAVAALSTTIGTGVIATGAVAYTLAVSQAYAENYEYTTSDNNAAAKLTAPTADDTITFIKESGFLTQGGGTINAHAVINQLKLTDGYSNVTYTFTNDVTGEGEFTFAAGTSANNQHYSFTGDVSGYSGDMTIASNKSGSFSFSNQTGTGSITTTNGTVNLNGATVNNSTITASTINISGITKINADTVMNFTNLKASEDAILSVLAEKSLTLNGTVSLYTPIMNAGTVNLGENIKFDLTNMTADEGVYTLFTFNAVDLSSLTEDNLVNKVSGYSYEFRDDGTILATQTSQNLEWNVPSGTWDTSTQNWLNGGNAAAYSAEDNVTFSYADAVVTLVGDVNPTDLTVAENTTFGGAGTISVAGTFGIAEGKTMTINDDVVLLLDSTEIATTVFESSVAGTGAVKLATDLEYGFGANKASTATGGLIVEKDKTLSLGNGDGRTVSIASFSAVELNGTIKYNNKKDTLNNLTVVNGVTGAIASTDMGNAADDILTMAGTTTVNGTLRLSNWWNGKFAIDELTGNGTLRLTAMSGPNNVAESLSSNEAATVTIHDMSGFSGTIQMRNAKMTLAFDTSTSSNATVLFNAGCGGTVRFSGEGNTYGLYQFNTDGSNNYDRRIVVDSGVIVNATNLFNTWGMHSITVEGELNLSELRLATGGNGSTANNLVTGNGTINTETLSIGNYGTYNVDIAHLNIGSGGLAAVSTNNCTLNLGTTEIGVTASWKTAANRRINLVSTDGTTFNTQSDTRGNSATLNGVIGGEGVLKKTGLGTLTLGGTNTYTGGTTISGGTLEAKVASALGTGAVTVEADGTLDLGVGNVLNAEQTVTNGGTVILHDTITVGTIDNGAMSSLVIGSDFAGLESVGIVGIDGGTEGNGFKQGGQATIFSGDGAVTGNLKAIFNDAEVEIQQDGTVTLADDFSTYHINNVLSTSETYSAIAAGAADHSATLKAIDFAVADQTLTVDAAGMATSMVIGSHTDTATLAVGNGQTLTADGDTAAAISVAAGSAVTVNVTEDSTVGAMSLGAGTTLNITGNGTLEAAAAVTDTLTVNTAAGSGVKLTSVEVAKDEIFTTQGDGVVTLTTTDQSKGLRMDGGSAVLNGTVNVLGSLYLKTNNAVATLDIAEGAFVTAGRVEAGDSAGGNAATITVASGATLKVTGGDVGSNGNTESYKQSGLILGEWASGTNLNVSGLLMAEHATMQPGDNSYVLTIAESGVVAVKGLGNPTTRKNDKTQGITANVNGGKLILGNGGINSTHNVATTLTDGTIGISADSVAINHGLVLAGSTGNTLDTAKYSFTDTAVTQGAAGGALAVSGIVSGEGKLIKAGAGTLTLSGANTYSGGTAVNAGTLSITSSTGLGTGEVTVAGGALTLDAADTISTGALTMTSGSIKLAGAEKLAIDGSVTLSGGTLDFSNLTIAAAIGNTVLGTVTGDVNVSGIELAGIDESILSQYAVSVMKNDGNLVLSVTDKGEPIYWNGGSGTWDATATEWGTVGDDTSTGNPYVAGSHVTISGTEGGTITVSGAQTAASLTIEHSGYSITRGGNSDTLTISGDLTLNSGASASIDFLPILGESSQIVVNEGATLNITINNPGADVLGVVLNKGTGAGTITVKDGGMIMSPEEGYTLNTNLTVDGGLWLNGPANAARTLTVTEGNTMTLSGKLSLNSGAEVVVDGGKLNAGEISLGHSGAAGYKGTLHLISGEVTTDFITITRTDTADVLAVDGGTLTIAGNTDGNAFVVGANDRAEVTISNAELTNSTTDMAFNHGSTLTDTTVTAKEGTTITVGGTGLTTNVVTGITTNGNVKIAGTTAISGDTTVTSNGALTIDSISATEGATLTTAGEGTTTVSAGAVDGLVVNAATTLGDVSVKNISGTNTVTQAASTTLTLVDGATLDGTVTIGDAMAAGTLSKTGSDTVTTGTITGEDAEVTVAAGTLSAAAITDVKSVTVDAGATLSSTGAVSATGDAEISGSLTADSLTAANITVAEGATVGATTGMVTEGTLTLNDSITLGSLEADTVSLAADKTLTVTGAADITTLTLGSVAATPAVSFGSLTSSAMEVDVAVTTLHSYFESAEGNSVTIATLGAASGTVLSLTNTQGGGYDYSITLDGTNIVISRDYSGIVWDGESGATWGDDTSWQGDKVPGNTDNVSFIGNEGTLVTSSVTIAAGGVEAGSVAVTGSEAVSADYSFVGGSLTAADLLVGNGSLSIENESTFTSGSVEETGSLTVNDDEASLEIGSLTVKGEMTVESGELNITDTLTTEEGATLAFNGGSAAIETAALGSDTIVIKAPASVLIGTVEGEDTTVQLAGELNVVAGDIKKIEGIESTYGNLTVGTVQTGLALTPTVTNDVAIAEASDVNNLTVTGTGNLAAQDTLHVHGTAEVAENGVVTVAKNTTIDGELQNSGDITIGSEAAPATLNTGKVTNDGTITVYNTMVATDDVTNNSGAELDVKGALTANTADKTVVNSGTLTVGGALAADTLTTNAGGTTEAKAGATIGTALTNHGKTTVTGNLVSADTAAMTPGSAVITNDATGSGEKLVVTGNLSGASLTTETGATTEIGGTTTLADGLTNKGTTTLTGAANVGGTLNNTGTLATGALTAETVANGGTLNVTGDATVKDLSSSVADSLMNVSGKLTIAEGGTLNSVGDITAGTLDLSKLEATDAVTIGDLKTDAITLNGLSSGTTGLTVETLAAKTAGKNVTISLADSIVDQLAELEENDTAQLVTVTSAASTGKIQLTTAAANKITEELDKKLLTYTISDSGVLTILDNSLDHGFNLSENAKAGMDMVEEAYLATGGMPTGDLKDITDALKTYRAIGNQAAAEKLAASVSGSSIAAMGTALSNDVDRQLRAIRNRTTTMGVDQCVVNEDMPYFNAWINAEGDFRKMDTDGSKAGYEMNSWGGTVGFDVDCTPRFTCGMALSAMYGDFKSNDVDNATGDIDSYYVSAFARYAAHRWTHTAVVTFGISDMSLDRTVGGAHTTGDTDGTSIGAMYEVGYVVALDEDKTTCLQPVANVSFRHVSVGGYTETGSDVALKVDDMEANVVTFGAGARLQSIVGENIYNRSSIFECRAMLKVDAGDTQGEAKTALGAFGGSTHTVKSAEMGKIGAEIGAGLTIPVGQEGGSIFVDGSAEFRSSYTGFNATVGYRVNF